MSKESIFLKKQKEHFSSDESSHITTDQEDLEKYVDKVEKQYHKSRRKQWWDNYQEYLKDKYPKNGIIDPVISSSKENKD